MSRPIRAKVWCPHCMRYVCAVWVGKHKFYDMYECEVCGLTILVPPGIPLEPCA